MVTTTQPARARYESLGWYITWEEEPCLVWCRVSWFEG